MFLSDEYLKHAGRAREAGNSGDAGYIFSRYRSRVNRLQLHDRLVMGRYEICWGMKPGACTIRTPVSWEILAREGTRLLLISENCLDWECFDGSGPFFGPAPEAAWSSCTLRQRLNGEFYEKTFAPWEKDLIVPTAVSPAGEDKLFLLSAEEVRQYFGSQRDPADTTAARAELLSAFWFSRRGPDSPIELSRTSHGWWLRDPGSDRTRAAYVADDGRIVTRGWNTDNDEGGVRPAMWIDLSLFDPEK